MINSAELSFELLHKYNKRESLGQFQLSIATKKAILEDKYDTANVFIVLPPKPSEVVKEIAACLEEGFTANGKGSSAYCITWPSAIPNVEIPSVVVSLLEFSESFITTLSEAEFDSLKTLVLRRKRLFWITKGSDPIMQTAKGFLRSLGNENPGLDYCFFHIDELVQHSAQSIAKLLERVLVARELEREYIEKGGEICCSRWMEKRDLSSLVGAGDGSQFELFSLGKARGALTLTSQKRDLGSQVIFVEDDLEQILADDEIEIDIKSVLIRYETSGKHATQHY